jgi:FAD:protein FMN transferase
MHSVKLSLGAMATRFELLLGGDDPMRLRAAGEEALAEIERLEAQLSFYRADSEISWINARAVSGIEQVEFDEGSLTVRFKRPGVELDLGGYGKGYAVDRAADILREAGITSALLDGGTSSVYAVGVQAGGGAWRVGLEEPLRQNGQPVVVGLSDSALSVSAGHGKEFTAGGRRYGHVIDPRTGEAVNGALAAAAGPSAAECEALSKALLVGGADWLTTLRERFPGCEGWVAPASGGNDAARKSSKISAL